MKLYKFLFLLFIIKTGAQNVDLVVGTYTNTCESKGIYIYDFNTATAEFSLKSTTEGVENPSYLSLSADNKFIYSVNESGKQSTVSAFGFSPETGKTKPLNKKDSGGADPCYIINDAKNVIVANYTGGSIAVFKKNQDGSLSGAKQVIVHKGSSANKQRQEGPHVHTVQFSPDGKSVFATDLGTDEIYIYEYNPEGGDKTLTFRESIKVKSGSGPRHLAFHHSGIFMYLLQEIDGTLTTFSYMKGKLEKIQETSIASTDPECENGAADIHTSPDGKFLYATNRGNVNTITVFKIHANGKIGFVEQVSTLGEGPRNFTITPNGDYLLVGHQQSNNIIIFKRDKVTGKLTDTGKQISLCSPVCLVFAPAK